MAKLIPFPRRRVRRLAARLLRLSMSRARASSLTRWRDRPLPPETLGNMLQRLAVQHPTVLLVLENVVAEMLSLIE